MLSLSSIYTQGEYVVEYDLTNNSISKIGNKIDDVTFIYPGFNTYNENASIFYFRSTLEKDAIYGVNTITGEIENTFVLDNATVVQNLTAIEFSNSLDKLFGILTDQTSETKQFVSIDFTNNELVPLGSPLMNSSSFQGYDSFNDKDALFTFTAPPNILYSISATSGEVIHSPEINLATGQAIQHYDYHPSSGKLYTLISENQGNDVFLATINIETGDIFQLGPSINDLGIGGSSAINSEDNLYMHLHFQGDRHTISTLSLATGENIDNYDFNVANPDNLIDLEYDNKSNKVFSKHWEAMTSGTSAEINLTPKLYPNPASNLISFENLNSSSEMFLDIYDSNGKKVLNNIQLENQKMQLSSLSNGLYIANIRTHDKLIYIAKFIVEK